WLGRWMSPDLSTTPGPVPDTDLTDPQSLNQYSYGRKIPTSNADIDGHQPKAGEKIEELAKEPKGVPATRRRNATATPGETLLSAGGVGLLVTATVGATYFAATHPHEAPAEGCYGPYCDMYVYVAPAQGRQQGAQNQGQNQGQIEEQHAEQAPEASTGGA